MFIFLLFVDTHSSFKVHYVRSLRISLAILLAALVVNCVGQDEPIVNLPDLGYIKGRITQTLGNLGHEKKPYYNFRNIPFAESVSGEYRFSVRKILYKPYFQNELPHNNKIQNEKISEEIIYNYLINCNYFLTFINLILIIASAAVHLS